MFKENAQILGVKSVVHLCYFLAKNFRTEVHWGAWGAVRCRLRIEDWGLRIEKTENWGMRDGATPYHHHHYHHHHHHHYQQHHLQMRESELPTRCRNRCRTSICSAGVCLLCITTPRFSPKKPAKSSLFPEFYWFFYISSKRSRINTLSHYTKNVSDCPNIRCQRTSHYASHHKCL